MKVPYEFYKIISESSPTISWPLEITKFFISKESRLTKKDLDRFKSYFCFAPFRTEIAIKNDSFFFTHLEYLPDVLDAIEYLNKTFNHIDIAIIDKGETVIDLYERTKFIAGFVDKVTYAVAHTKYGKKQKALNLILRVNIDCEYLKKNDNITMGLYFIHHIIRLFSLHEWSACISQNEIYEDSMNSCETIVHKIALLNELAFYSRRLSEDITFVTDENIKLLLSEKMFTLYNVYRRRQSEVINNIVNNNFLFLYVSPKPYDVGDTVLTLYTHKTLIITAIFLNGAEYAVSDGRVLRKESIIPYTEEAEKLLKSCDKVPVIVEDINHFNILMEIFYND